MTDDSREALAVAAGIVTHAGKVLLVRRTVTEGTLSWQFPAGKVEPGERVEAAAVREVAEETGVTVSAVKLIGERTHPVTGRRMHYIACHYQDGQAHVVDPRETAEVAWCDRREMAQRIPAGVFEPVAAFLATAFR